MFISVTKEVIIVQIKPRNDKFTLLAAHVRDKDHSNHQLAPLCSKHLTLECCKKTFEDWNLRGLFESSTFVYALQLTHNTHTNMVEPADESCHQKNKRRKVLCCKNTRLPG